MPTLILYVPGKPLLNGHKQRNFLWSAAHACYLYEGAEIEAADFNAKYELAMKTNADLRPRVRVIDAGNATVAVGEGSPAGPAPVATITVAAAESVLERLAPHRLKKKTGPKPRAGAMMEVA